MTFKVTAYSRLQHADKKATDAFERFRFNNGWSSLIDSTLNYKNEPMTEDEARKWQESAEDFLIEAFRFFSAKYDYEKELQKNE